MQYRHLVYLVFLVCLVKNRKRSRKIRKKLSRRVDELMREGGDSSEEATKVNGAIEVRHRA